MQKPRTAIGGIYHFIKALVFLLTVVIQSVTIVMLLTAIKNDSGYLWANIALVCVTAIYLVVFVISAFTGGRRAKRAKKNASRLKKIVKLFLKIATTFISVYSVCIAYEHITVFAVLFAYVTFSACGLQLLFEFILIGIDAKREKSRRRAEIKAKEKEEQKALKKQKKSA